MQPEPWVAVVAKKDVSDDGVAATVVVADEASVMETAQPLLKEEDELPRSTMADEAPGVDKADEAKEGVVAEETKEESPASTNEGGKSRSIQN
jgi:hypothetical protein